MNSRDTYADGSTHVIMECIGCNGRFFYQLKEDMLLYQCRDCGVVFKLRGFSLEIIEQPLFTKQESEENPLARLRIREFAMLSIGNGVKVH